MKPQDAPGAPGHLGAVRHHDQRQPAVAVQHGEQVEDIMFRHLESRVAKAVVQLAENTSLHFGVRSPSVELHVPQRELGNMAGGCRESVNKQLQIWCRQGLIELSKGSIMIRDIEAIRRLI